MRAGLYFLLDVMTYQTPQQEKLAELILVLLAQRRAGASICPSDAARAYAASKDSDDWRSLMEPTREAARILALQGIIAVTQKGRALQVDGPWRGAIRLKLA